jgi:fatty acid desaturase
MLVDDATQPRTVTTANPGQVRGLAGEARAIMEVSRGLVAFNLAYLAASWAVAIGSIVLFWVHPAWYTFVLAFLLVSARHQALLNLEHEAIHGKLVAGRRGNALIGRWLCAAPVGSPFEASRARHLSHHRLLATDEDPDHDLHAGPGKRTRGGLFKHFAGGLVGGYAGMVLMGPPRKEGGPAAPGSRRRDAQSIALAQIALWGAFTLAFDWWVYPALWLAPLVTVTVLGHLIRSFVEHAITDDELPEHGNRLITIPAPFVERFMWAPYWMNYHAEHHLLPSVPAPRLKELHARLQKREDVPPVLIRPSYSQALRRYVRALPDD